MGFIEKWVLNARTGAIDREIDTIRSTHPWSMASGHLNFTASTYFDSIIPAVSTKVFILQNLAINNRDDNPNYVYLYDGQSASTGLTSAFGIQINTSTTEFINGLRWPIWSGLYASNKSSQLEIRVQGVLITSEP